jgi:hypothetical protein
MIIFEVNLCLMRKAVRVGTASKLREAFLRNESS